MRGVLFDRYGVKLEEVAGICAEIQDAAAANRPKKKKMRLTFKQPG